MKNIIVSFLSFLLFSTASFAADKATIGIKNPLLANTVARSEAWQLHQGKIAVDLESAILATRKFEVLSRQQEVLKEVRDEQKFAASDFSKGDAAKEGELAAADYLLVPLAKDFSMYRQHKPIPNLSGKYIRNDYGSLKIEAQVIDTTSGAIKSTFTASDSFATRDEIVGNTGGSPSTALFSQMSKNVAQSVAKQLLEAVFPARIISIGAGEVWINRGANTDLKVGDKLVVYREGESLVDPDTEEVLGNTETEVAKIEIIKINPKYSVAKVVSSSDSVPAKGDIIRKSK